MRVVVTGASGFIGRHVVAHLARRGEDVVALVRDPSTTDLAILHGVQVQVVQSDLGDAPTLTGLLAGADAVIHAAGSYRAGITKAERPAMLDANLGTTERVLDASTAADVPRVVYLSTIGAFGNTHSRVVDETYRRDPAEGYLSYYDESKWLAHLAVEARIAAGSPTVIVHPGFVYGPRDHSGVGHQLEAAFRGTAPFIGLGGLGVSLVHVDDLASGIAAAMDHGRPGRAYVLGGPNVRFRDAMAAAAMAGGRRPPRLSVPDWVLRLGATVAPDAGGWFGLDPNLREIVSSSIGVTYWASSVRANSELGYAPRGLHDGFTAAYGAPAPTA